MKRVIYFLILFLISNNLFGQTYSTVGEVYNFDIGDEFHYVHVNYDYLNDTSYRKIIILDKYVSNGYLFYESEITYFKTNVTVTKIDSFAQNSLNLSIFDPSVLPSGMIVSSMSAAASPTHGNRKMNNIEYNDTDFEPTLYTYKYLEGCGLFYEYYIFVTGARSLLMFYYKKGNEVWGDPLSSVKELPKELVAPPIIAPNPIKENATVKFALNVQADIAIKLFDLSGKELRDYQSAARFPAGEQQLELDLSNLPGGMYLCRILVNGEVVTLKLVK